MEVSFIGQGFEPESRNAVGNILKTKLEDNRYSHIFIISAFASSFTMDFLHDKIQSNPSRPHKNYTVIVGVDQEGTSREALEKLLQLRINSFVFYQKESPIFHPKIYLCEGNNDTALIVGSSNLTGQGLFNNIESSILIEFKSDDEQGKNVVNQLKEYFKPLFDFTDPNLFKLTAKLIQSLIDNKIVPTKKIWEKRYSKNGSKADNNDEDTLTIPQRQTARIPKAFKGKYRTNKVVSELIEEIEYKHNVDLTVDKAHKMLWSCSGLTRRDLNIPTSGNTHPTGSMTLRKGNFTDIDQRHYFYDTVFSSLKWQRIGQSKHRFVADCDFRMVILGIDYGVYHLKITHNTDTESETYKQNNSMSHLRWEEAKRLVAQEELLQESLYILKNINTGEFVIEIK